jgi:hypothetical protein
MVIVAGRRRVSEVADERAAHRAAGLRLEAAGVVTEAPRLRLKSKGFITEVEALEGDSFQVRRYPEGK